MKVVKGGIYFCALCGEQLITNSWSNRGPVLSHRVLEPEGIFRRVDECPDQNKIGLLPVIELEDK